MIQRNIVIGEVILTYELILVQLWFVGKTISPFTFLPLSVILSSWIFHKDSLQTFGLSHFDLKGTKFLWLFFIGITIILFMVGGYFRSFHAQSAHLIFFQFVVLLPGIALRCIAYIIPAFCQQVVLNSYFVNRIQFLYGKSKFTAIITGILFSLVHLPNPVLSVLTLMWGAISADYF